MIRWAAIAVLAILSALPARAQAPPMGINMSHLRDWSSSQPFLDVMKTARRWIGHRPGQWGGMSYDELVAMGVLDDDGWPVRIPSELSSVGTVILTDLPEGADIYAGRYVLRFEGTGIVEVTGRATNKRYGKNEVSFDFTPGPGPVEIRIQRSDRRGTGDYVRNITVLREDRVALYDAGATFNPDWTGMLAGFEVLRFMNWTLTNESQASDWAARARATDFSYTRHGVPYEVMLKLSDLVGADPWFSIPHLADDGYVNGFCTLMRDRMSPDRKVYVEQLLLGFVKINLSYFKGRRGAWELTESGTFVLRGQDDDFLTSQLNVSGLALGPDKHSSATLARWCETTHDEDLWTDSGRGEHNDLVWYNLSSIRKVPRVCQSSVFVIAVDSVVTAPPLPRPDIEYKSIRVYNG